MDECWTERNYGALLIMIRKIFTFIYLLFILSVNGIQHTNLFEPYEWILDANRLFLPEKNYTTQISVRPEFGYNFRGYPLDIKEAFLENYNTKSIAANPVQYLNFIENDYAPFLGTDTKLNSGQFSQQFNPYNGLTASQTVDFNGEISLFGLTGLFEKWVSRHIKIGYYIPYYQLQLKNLMHTIREKKQFFENEICPDIYLNYQKNGSPAIPYTVRGLGDSMCLVSWQNYFYENRDFISGLLAALRGGLYLPTGMHKNYYSETFLKIPLGYDAAWGIPFGGSLELDFGCYAGAGISADCITFFGSLMPRYIKTDMRQTDMLVLEEVNSILNPGFKESFSVYVTGHDLEKTFLGSFCYQYNKQNESDIILCDTQFSNLIAQSQDLLENWTTHNLILSFQGEYAFSGIYSTYSGFLKWGFDGQRSIVANTVGVQVNINF